MTRILVPLTLQLLQSDSRRNKMKNVATFIFAFLTLTLAACTDGADPAEEKKVEETTPAAEVTPAAPTATEAAPAAAETTAVPTSETTAGEAPANGKAAVDAKH
jgi:hypothetical protein